MAEFFIPMPRAKRTIRERRTLDTLSSYEVRKNCGMTIEAVKSLIDEIGPAITGIRSTSISAETKVLIFLSYLRSGNFQWSLGTLSNTSQRSVSKAITEVCFQILKLGQQYIKFPTTEQERISNFLGFYAMAGLPKILGVVDGTHVGMIRPRKDEHIFVNRKGYHSINCQVVVDHKLNFIDVVAKWPGSTHDSFMFKNSSLCQRLTNGEGDDGVLLGKKLKIRYH